MSTTISSGSLIRRTYSNFRGVDFGNRKDEIELTRSPDALNMWKNYKNSKGRCVESRPDVELVKQYKDTDTIFGHFFYTYGGQKHTIIHINKSLYDNELEIYSNMAEHKSQFFIFEDKLYIKDATNYLVFNGYEVKEVEGYIPTTVTAKSPTGDGTIYQDANLLTGIRKNMFVGDGKSTEYQLDTEKFDDDYTVRCWINDNEITEFTTSPENGKIIFNTAPPAPNTDGQSNVTIQFRKTIEGARAKIENCTLIALFDNRVFFSGNPNYPNKLWHCSLSNPTYCSDLDYYDEGFGDSDIKALIVGNNALWVLKAPSQTNTTIFYLNPTTDDDYGKVYPTTHSSISTGCLSTGVNFFDDIVFLSDRGLEGISSDITTQQVIMHRSSFVDNKLLNEDDYKNATLEIWEGYLLIIVKNHVYLADSRAKTTYNSHMEYEWFYWEFEEEIMNTCIDDGVLFLNTKNKIFTLTKSNSNVKAYWTTPEDEFGYPQYQKSTNKKGFTLDMEGNNIIISVKTDNNEFEEVKELENKKGYVVTKVKQKKWKCIQMKFSSDKPFGIFSSTLEAYIGAYVKR